MRKLIALLIAGVLGMTSSQVLARADVEIIWENPEDYTDVKAANESRKRFRERTIANLEKYILKLAEKLPDGQKLTMKVTDIDLAGQVWPASFVGLGAGGNDVRLIKSIDIPRMKFDYKLTDPSGRVLQQATDFKLKDMAFQDRFNPMFDSESLRYEKNMLKGWFEEEFEKYLVKQS